ncbi:alkaline phosphatase PhoX [Flavobacterium davisii]|uniref:alkaline phosphatase PhoX n=1 Tax=Flavobacterium davisii TaxID=2906077 RepID=UPI001F267933|nr:alkaline phosphatase PhoX [Flavobacterium davisii]
MKIKKTSLFTIIIIASLVACNKQDESNETTSVVNPYELRNHSVTPPLIKAMPEFSSLQTYSLFSSEDKLVQTPDYVFGGSADGSGLIRNTDDTFTFLVNNEDNFAVSKITFDKTFKPVAGQYILNSNGAGTRLCSATLATPEIHGFGPLFLTCGESNSESLIHGLTPFDSKANNSTPRPLTALGRWSAENAVPLSKNAYNGQTVIIIGDDDNGTYGGQLILYKSTIGDLNNGKVYVLKRTNNDPVEKNMTENNSYDVEFVEITDIKTNTGLQNNQAAQALNALTFGRVEDIDWNKTTGKEREIYFNVTGQNNTGVNAITHVINTAVYTS